MAPALQTGTSAMLIFFFLSVGPVANTTDVPRPEGLLNYFLALKNPDGFGPV